MPRRRPSTISEFPVQSPEVLPQPDPETDWEIFFNRTRGKFSGIIFFTIARINDSVGTTFSKNKIFFIYLCFLSI